MDKPHDFAIGIGEKVNCSSYVDGNAVVRL
jgi:hypothetical protein